jgi:hypothetical protein
MATTAWLIRSRLRARRTALAVIALVAILGATGTFVAAAAADRTARAYSSYLHRAAVADVTINPSLVSKDIDHLIRTLPGVERVTHSALFSAAIYDGPPPTKAQLDNDASSALVLGSNDGRYTAMDRPAMVEGRLPTGHHEVLLNVEEAEHEHYKVGQVVPLSFWSRRVELFDPPNTVERPFAVEHATVVGIATLSDEVLPDGVYPRTRVIVSSDIAARFDCLPAGPGPNESAEDALAALAPGDCAVSYDYYALSIRGGDRGVTATLDAFAKRSDALSARLPKPLRDQHIAYTLVAKTRTHDEQLRVEHSVAPISAALFVLAGAAGAITITIMGLVIARELNRARADQLAWWRLGLTTRERWSVVVVPLLIAAGVGLVGAVPMAWLLSPAAPIGTVRSIDPAPARELSRGVWVAVLVLTAAFAISIALLALRSSRRVASQPTRPPTSAVRRVLRASNRPAVDDGIRAAYSTNRGSGLVIALAGSAVAVFLAAVVFGSSLAMLTSTPASYGWPWDVAVLGNFGYGGMKTPAIKAALDRHPDVRSWTALGFANSVTLDGDAVPTVFSFDRVSTVAVAVVSGHLPRADHELALGARTAAEHGLHVGDEVTVAGYEVASKRAKVTGIVVLPALGPFQADRAGPGEGMLIPQAMIRKSTDTGTVSFVGIEIEPNADRAAVLARVRDASSAWVPPDSAVARFTKPVRPAEIINARSVRSAPLFVGGLLVVAATVGLGAAIIISVRSRRHEMAILRTLGFTGGQLRGSVRIQALAMMFGGFVVGAPLGIAIGRIAWRAFASRLGVVTATTIPIGWIVVTALGAAAVALLAAAGPARVAARAEPSVSLRSE